MLEKISAGPMGAHMIKGNRSPEELKKACLDFESVFLTHMLKSARAAMSQPGLPGNGPETNLIREMFDENLAVSLANAGGIGLAQVLFEGFTHRDAI